MKRSLYTAAIAVICLGIVFSIPLVVTVIKVGDDLNRINSLANGWDKRGLSELREWIDRQDPFVLRDSSGRRAVQDNSSRRVCLWEAVRQVGGEYPDPHWQETGDCTSWGAAHAICCTHACQIVAGDPIDYQRVYQPWLYGSARVWIWKPQLRGRLPGAGCTGAAVARAATEYGLLSYETPGIPAYTGSLADQWGRQGPPAKFQAEAAKHKIQTAPCHSVADVRDAICNGYGVSIASEWGNPAEKYDRIDGRLVARRTGTWAHQMCVDGYDGSTKGRRYYHIQNSWPPGTHPDPIDDSPRGGFWIREADLEDIVSEGDTWAFSQGSGFTARDLDLHNWKPKRAGP